MNVDSIRYLQIADSLEVLFEFLDDFWILFAWVVRSEFDLRSLDYDRFTLIVFGLLLFLRHNGVRYCVTEEILCKSFRGLADSVGAGNRIPRQKRQTLRFVLVVGYGLRQFLCLM